MGESNEMPTSTDNIYSPTNLAQQESFEQQQKLNVDITSVTSIDVKDPPTKPGELPTVKESPESGRDKTSGNN